MSVTTADRSIDSLHPAAQKACRLFLEECKKEGLDIFLTETYRSPDRQKWLYAQGRTRFPGPIVTWTLNSNHMSKLAWDIAVNPPKSLYDTATLNAAGAIAKRLGIEWGGDWRPTIDRPHFQVSKNWTAPVTTASQSTNEVKKLQTLLNQVGFSLGVDGIAGKSTLNAIQKFQSRVGLTVDGIAGPETMAALKKVIAEKNTEQEKESIPLAEQKNAQASASLAKEVALAKEAGITDGTFLHRTATREEVAAMNYRVYDKLKKELKKEIENLKS